MTDKKIEEIAELIYLSEKILNNPLIPQDEKEKRKCLISTLVEEILAEGGPTLFFQIEEKIVEKLKNF